MPALTTTLLLLLPAADTPVEVDVVIRGATLYDGSGQPGKKGDGLARSGHGAGTGRDGRKWHRRLLAQASQACNSIHGSGNVESGEEWA